MHQQANATFKYQEHSNKQQCAMMTSKNIAISSISALQIRFRQRNLGRWRFGNQICSQHIQKCQKYALLCGTSTALQI